VINAMQPIIKVFYWPGELTMGIMCVHLSCHGLNNQHM